MVNVFTIRFVVKILNSRCSKQNDEVFRVSYNIATLIEKTVKLHPMWDDLILLAVKEVLATVHPKPVADIRTVPLSNSSVQRRIDEMAKYIEESLCNHLKPCQVSIQMNFIYPLKNLNFPEIRFIINVTKVFRRKITKIIPRILVLNVGG